MIEIGRGVDRVVYGIGGGRVLKSARFDLGSAIAELRGARGHGSEHLRRVLGLTSSVYQSPAWHIMHGRDANRREFELAADFPDIVAPTKTSPSNAFNIQPKAEPLLVDPVRIFAHYVGGRLGHLIEQPGNFGVLEKEGEKKVYIVDGGDARLEELLRRGGEWPSLIQEALSRVLE